MDTVHTEREGRLFSSTNGIAITLLRYFLTESSWKMGNEKIMSENETTSSQVPEERLGKKYYFPIIQCDWNTNFFWSTIIDCSEMVFQVYKERNKFTTKKNTNKKRTNKKRTIYQISTTRLAIIGPIRVERPDVCKIRASVRMSIIK